MPMLLAFALQAVTSVSAAPPAKFSIVEDCVRNPTTDVVVCGRNPATENRLPLPDDAPPLPNYVKPDSGDYRDNNMQQAAPCAALQGGCQVGFGPPIAPMIAAAAKAIGNAAKDRHWAKARARDGARRQAIDLNAAPAPGHLEP